MQSVVASPPGLQGQLTVPAIRAKPACRREGGPRQQPLSGVEAGGRIDARLEKAACAIERAPRVGSTDAHPGPPRADPSASITRGFGASPSAGCPAPTRPTSRPGAHRAPSGRLVAGRKVPRRGASERNASNWLDPGQDPDAAASIEMRRRRAVFEWRPGDAVAEKSVLLARACFYGRRPERANTISTPSTRAAVVDAGQHTAAARPAREPVRRVHPGSVGGQCARRGKENGICPQLLHVHNWWTIQFHGQPPS